MASGGSVMLPAKRVGTCAPGKARPQLTFELDSVFALVRELPNVPRGRFRHRIGFHFAHRRGERH
jgi:hypothetical protein